MFLVFVVCMSAMLLVVPSTFICIDQLIVVFSCTYAHFILLVKNPSESLLCAWCKAWLIKGLSELVQFISLFLSFSFTAGFIEANFEEVLINWYRIFPYPTSLLYYWWSLKWLLVRLEAAKCGILSCCETESEVKKQYLKSEDSGKGYLITKCGLPID